MPYKGLLLSILSVFFEVSSRGGEPLRGVLSSVQREGYDLMIRKNRIKHEPGWKLLNSGWWIQMTSPVDREFFMLDWWWQDKLAHQCDDKTIRAPGTVTFNQTKTKGLSVYGRCSNSDCLEPIAEDVKNIIRFFKRMSR